MTFRKTLNIIEFIEKTFLCNAYRTFGHFWLPLSIFWIWSSLIFLWLNAVLIPFDLWHLGPFTLFRLTGLFEPTVFITLDRRLPFVMVFLLLTLLSNSGLRLLGNQNVNHLIILLVDGLAPNPQKLWTQFNDSHESSKGLTG